LQAAEYCCEIDFNPVRSAPLADGGGLAPMRRSRALRREHIAPALGRLQCWRRRSNIYRSASPVSDFDHPTW
jgi:hypothetical protein